MSYNTWYAFTARHEYVTLDKADPEAWVLSQQPDVVGLQELTDIKPERLQELAEAWGHQNSSLLKTSGFSVGLTSRWPIETIEKRVRDMHHGYLHAKTEGVHYFVVHLSPFKWEVRRREAKILMGKIAPLLKQNENVVVLGDFNAVSEEDQSWLEAKRNVKILAAKKESDAKHGHVQNLKDGKFDYEVMNIFFRGGLKDSATGHLPQSFETRVSLNTVMWNQNKTTTEEGERIDFILCSEGMQEAVQSCQIITKGEVNKISDHYPVVVDFEPRE
ncbi:MAG: endonuclease/exonuclease/phosphatase family protein [Planctomycetota bacterium]